MRKFIFIIFIIVGTSAGVLAAYDETQGLVLVLGSIGAVVGTAIGGAITGVGSSGRRSHVSEQDTFTDMCEQRSENFWLDRGRLTDAPGLPCADDLDPHSFEP